MVARATEHTPTMVDHSLWKQRNNNAALAQKKAFIAAITTPATTKDILWNRSHLTPQRGFERVFAHARAEALIPDGTSSREMFLPGFAPLAESVACTGTPECFDYPKSNRASCLPHAHSSVATTIISELAIQGMRAPVEMINSMKWDDASLYN